jgi:hypothetical protein
MSILCSSALYVNPGISARLNIHWFLKLNDAKKIKSGKKVYGRFPVPCPARHVAQAIFCRQLIMHAAEPR